MQQPQNPLSHEDGGSRPLRFAAWSTVVVMIVLTIALLVKQLRG